MTDHANPFAFVDATGQAALVASGEITPAELVGAAVDAAGRLNDELNAIIHPRYDEALAEAAGDLPDGPFRGVPMVLKDLDGFQAGAPYHGGIQALADAGYTPDTDSWLTERFRAMGAVIIGRTNTPELGLVPSTEPAAYGPTRNPWDTSCSAAGSSGGSAAAVAAGIVPLGHAGDGGGSIRLPASVCGLVGLKPSRGRITLGPEAGEAWGGLVARLVVTRTVRDTARVLDAVAGPGPGDPTAAPAPRRPWADELGVDPGQLRVAWTVQPPDPAVVTQPAVAAAVAAVAAGLESLGHHVDELQPQPWADEAAAAGFTGHFVNALAVWTATEIANLSARSGVDIGPDGTEPGTWALVELGRMVGGVQFQQALDGLAAYTRDMVAWWDAAGIDVLVTPTVPEQPWQLGQFAPDPANPLAGVARSAAIVPFTAPFNVTGQPAVSLPLGWTDDGLPVGVQVVARHGCEDVLVRLASQLEVAMPWADRRPPVHA
jgi:amidase